MKKNNNNTLIPLARSRVPDEFYNSFVVQFLFPAATPPLAAPQSSCAVLHHRVVFPTYLK
jgi:hypothetical protein